MICRVHDSFKVKCIKTFFFGLIYSIPCLLVLVPVSDSRPATPIPDSFLPLIKDLRNAGFQFRYSNPPIQGAYGATNARTKVVWVAPISVDLGIGRQTLIHEAVHAAQSCPTRRYEPIGWVLPKLPKAVDREIAAILYRKYPHKQFQVEREAFFMQSHPNAFGLIKEALSQRCR